MATARNKENDTADRKHVLRGPYKGHVDILLCSHSDVCVCVWGGARRVQVLGLPRLVGGCRPPATSGPSESQLPKREGAVDFATHKP